MSTLSTIGHVVVTGLAILCSNLNKIVSLARSAVVLVETGLGGAGNTIWEDIVAGVAIPIKIQVVVIIDTHCAIVLSLA